MLDCTAPALPGDLPCLAVKKHIPGSVCPFLFSMPEAQPSCCCTTVKIRLLTHTTPSGSWCDPGEAQLVCQLCLTKCPFQESQVLRLCSAAPADTQRGPVLPLWKGGREIPVQGGELTGKCKFCSWEILMLQNLAVT